MGNQAIIAKIDRVIEIPGANTIHVGVVLGESVIVSKEWDVGKVGVLFPVGVQLSDGTHIVMCHYPLAIWDKCHRGSFMLHGHSHGGYQPQYGKILDVGIDNHYKIYGYYGYFDEKKIKEYMSSREFKALDHHTERTNQ